MTSAQAGSVRGWIAGARPQTLALILAPIAVGISYAYIAYGPIDWIPVAAAAVSAMSIQIATNLANDSADGGGGLDGADRLGPMRLVGAGVMSATRVRRGAQVATLVAALAGLIAVAWGGASILALGVASLCAAWGYSYGPAPISASPLGEVFVVMFFGVAATSGIVWLGVHRVDVAAVFLGLAVGLPAAAVLTLNNHRDRAQDVVAGRRTMAILLGPSATPVFYGVELAAASILAGAALWSLSRAAAAAAIGAFVVAVLMGRKLAFTPISRAMNRQLVATVRFEIGLAAAIIAALLIGAR